VILDQIIADTRVALANRRVIRPEGALREQLSQAPQPLDVTRCLRRRGVSIVAEIKRVSPSRGALDLNLEPAQIAVAYASAGAEAISVLTEAAHFRGSLEDLGEVRRSLAKAQITCPLLCKDFIIDSYQVLEARVWGADAVLLIAAALDDSTLARLYEDVLSLNLTPLVEVHNKRELIRVLSLDPLLVGINNRDLKSFTVDLEMTRRLRPLIPSSCAVISESGIHHPAQVRELAALQVDAALIGEALVTAEDPAAKLRELKEAGR